MNQVPLSEWIYKLESGARPKGGVKKGSGDIPSLGAEHLADDGGFNFDNLKLIPSEFYQTLGKGRIRYKDILIVKDGATTGKVSFVGDDFPYEEAAINEHVFRLRIDEAKADPGFVFRFLQSPIGQAAIQKDFRGATVGGIGRTFVEKVFLPSINLAEQKRIADILDKADGIRRKRQLMKALSSELIKSVFLALFGDPVLNPKHWAVEELESVCSKVTDGTHDTPPRTTDGVMFITGKNIKPFQIDLAKTEFVSKEVHEEIFKRCNPQYGDVLYTNIGANTGTAAFNGFEFEFSMKNVALLKPNRHVLSGRYLEFLLNHPGFKESVLSRFGMGGAQGFIGLKSIKRILIPVPSFDTQKAFEELVHNANVLNSKLSQQERAAVRLFSSISHFGFRDEL